MQDRDNRNLGRGYNKVDNLRKPAHEGTTYLGVNRREWLETFGDTVEQATECRYETCLQSEPLPFVPSHRVLDIVLGAVT